MSTTYVPGYHPDHEVPTLAEATADVIEMGDYAAVELNTLCPDADECSHVTVCEVCETQVCSEHSNEFATCADSWHSLHHLACVDECTRCQHADSIATGW